MMRSGGDRRSLPELLSELTTGSSTLVRQELQLAVVEVRGEALTAAKGSAVLVVPALWLLVTSVAAVVGIRKVR